jgi:fumarylpyruvate hydrolase
MSRLVRVRGEGERAAGTVYALGRNFAEHAREMGATTDPVVFIKPASSLLPGGGVVPWPEGSAEVHHEVELVLLLGAGGARLDDAAALRAVAALGVGVDLTARDLQREAKKQGWPWARSKGFPAAAPVSDFVPLTRVDGPLDEIDLELDVDGTRRQRGSVAQMIRPPAQVVALLSRWFELAAGDVVFTGTPSGVGPLEPGAKVSARSRRLGLDVSFRMGPPGP